MHEPSELVHTAYNYDNVASSGYNHTRMLEVIISHVAISYTENI